MRRPLIALAMLLALAAAVPAQAAYDHVSGGTANPSTVAAGGGTDYSVSITGRPAAVDVVLVLDNSGSMSTAFGGGSRWSVLETEARSFVADLSSSGFFARGGKVGVVLFETSAHTAAAPTSNVEAINNGIAGGAPGGEGCIACGLQRATELLTAIPESSKHRRIAYIVADGENTGASPTISEAVAAAGAAGVERRVIGLGSGASSAGLEAFDSDGSVSYPNTGQELNTAFGAQPTAFSGATNLSWAFHLTPGFTASAPTASKGAASIAGSDVNWTIPSLGGEETATLSFHATHAASSGCTATSLLTGTTFADSEGDAAPVVGLAPVSLTGCPPAGGGKLDASAVILLPKSSSKCARRKSIALKLRPPPGTSVGTVSVKIGNHKAKAYTGRQAAGTIKLKGLPQGRFKVKVTVTLSDGRTATLVRSYRNCPKPR